MTIEGRVYFLGKIPIGPKCEIPSGEKLPGNIEWDIKGLLGAAVSSFIMETGIFAFTYANPDKAIKIIDEETVEGYKNGERVIFSRDEINSRENIKVLKSPFAFPPGFSIRFSYRKDLSSDRIVFQNGKYRNYDPNDLKMNNN